MRVTPRAVLLLALLALLAPPLFPEGNDAPSWLRSEPRARAYEPVRLEILRIFDDAQKAGVPTGPLEDKLKEGVSKRVPADVLITGLRAELDRLSLAGSLLAGRGSAFDPGKREAALRTISLLLASGASPQLIGSLLDTGSSAARDPSDTVEALGVLAQVKLSIRLPDTLVLTLGDALLKSRMPQAAFGSIPPLLMQARANGMNSEELISMIVGVLQSGGGLIQVQDRLRDLASGNQAGKARGEPGAGSAPAGVSGGMPHPPVRRKM